MFAALVLTLLHGLPQAALIAGAAIGAIVSYNGHRWFSFLPRACRSRPTAQRRATVDAVSTPTSSSSAPVRPASPPAYCLTKAAALGHRHREGPALCRRHQPHRALQGLPVRHRRPPLLLQVEGGGRSVARDPARRFHRAAAPVAHLLRRQILFLSAEGVRGADAISASSPARLCMLSYAYRQGAADPRAAHASTTGCATSSASGCSRSSSRPTPRRCGACRATRFPPTGRRSASRGSTSASRCGTRSRARSSASARQAAGGAVVKTLIESFQYPRLGPGMMWEAAASKIRAQGGRLTDGPRTAVAALRRRAQALDASTVTTATAARDLHRAARDQLGAGARACRQAQADADLAAACARTALPRLPHRGADGEQARPVPRQLDLHPRPVGEGRPGAELPLLVAGDGAGPA